MGLARETSERVRRLILREISLRACGVNLASQRHLMRLKLTAIISACLLPWVANAQFGSFGDIPVEITADGETRFEGGVAIAEDNVQIHYGEIGIYTSYAEYNPDTRDVLLIGDVRIYTEDNLFTGQRALYNLETKQIRALEFKGESAPLRFRAMSLRAPSLREFRVGDAEFTVEDSSQPSFRIKSRRVRFYADDRVVFSNSTVYIGKVPVFWLPYLFAFVNNPGVQIQPGYDSRWGYYLLTGYSFPLAGGDIIATTRLDYRSDLGLAVGLDAEINFGENDRNFGLFRSYYTYDTDLDDKVGGPGEPTEPGDPNRYRISYQQRLFLTDDIYATVDINKLSDIDFLEDYFPAEFSTDPQPDNFLALTKWDEFYTLTLLARFQLNDFYQTTERRPELALDIKQHQLFGSPINYDGENSIGSYRRAFAEGSIFPDYDAVRFDTFHQISYPRTYFGWLSLIPKVGIRGTYYDKTVQTVDSLSQQQILQIANLQNFARQSDFEAQATENQINAINSQLQSTTDPDERAALETAITTLAGVQQGQIATSSNLRNRAEFLEGGGSGFQGRSLETGPGTFRPVMNLGLEGSFKLSRKYEWAQSRLLGLDGVLHVTQPYFNYSYVYNAGKGPDEIPQFDRVVPATNVLPIDFPQFVAIDSIDTWSILRLGVRNRLTTRRGDVNFAWFEIDSFFDVNMDNPYIDDDVGSVSNMINRVTFNPLPWIALGVEAQMPLINDGFTDVNTYASIMPARNLLLQVSNRYLDDNPFFPDSSQTSGYVYYQVNSNWGLSAQGTYEAEDSTLLLQRYMVHRDLSAWVVSFGGEVRENAGPDGETEFGLLFTMSLKDAPQITLPLAFDPGTGPMGGGSE